MAGEDSVPSQQSAIDAVCADADAREEIDRVVKQTRRLELERPRQLETFGWSGWVFNDLEMYLENRNGFTYSKFGDDDASRQLSKARGSDWLVLPAASAAELRAALDGVTCEAGDMKTFFSSEHGPDNVAEGAAAVQAALTILKTWLAEVSPGSVRLMSVG